MSAQCDEGRYRVLVSDQRFDRSSDKGTPAFVMAFRTRSKLDQSGETPTKSYQRDVWFWLTEKTVDRVLSELQALGFAGEDFDGVDPRIPGFHDFRNLEAIAICEHETVHRDGKDELVERWRFEIRKPSPQDRSDIEYLNRLLRKKKRRAAAQSVAVADNHEDEHGITDADVPF